MTRSQRIGLALLALLLPSAAFADPKDDARRHFIAGLEAAKEGEFEVALQRFLAAQEAYPHPNTLYNIARAYQDLGDLENALTYYTLFREASPDRSGDVQPVIDVLAARVNQGRSPTGAQPLDPGSMTSGTGPAIIVGPTAEELARLQAISAELEALAQSIQDRQTEASIAGTGPAPGGDTDVGGNGGTADTELPDLPDQGFLGEAYERIVVTASRYGQAPLDSPSTITVLTSDDLRLSGASTIEEALRRVVGVDVMQMAARHNEISIRGFNREVNNKVLVLIDGRSVYWDFIGTTFWANLPITLPEVERIEIIRGPGSAVYGANAVTGVINIITKTPGETPQTIVKAELGNLDHRKVSGFTTGRVGSTSYRFAAEYEREGRWERPVDVTPDGPYVSNASDQNVAQEGIRGSGRIDKTFLDKGFVSLQGGFWTGETEFYNIGVLGNYHNANTHTFVRADAAYGPIHFRTFWNRDRTYVSPWAEPVGRESLGTLAAADNVDVELEGSGSFETGIVRHVLNVGAGYRLKRLGNFDLIPGDVTEHHFNVFLNEEATIGRLKLVASLRADRHPLLSLDKTISPRGAAIFRVAENTSIRINGGTAYRAMNLVESYMDFALSTGADGIHIRDFGDRNLRPERIVTVEAGVHDESTLYHTADLAVFYNRVTNLIELDAVTNGINPFNETIGGFQAGTTGWINTSNVFQGFGAELEAEFFPVDGMDIFANLNVQAILEDDGTETFRNKATSLVKANAGITYRTGYRTDLTLSTFYVSPQTWRNRAFDAAGNIIQPEIDLPARVYLNARAGVRPIPGNDLELAISGWNLLAFSDAFRNREHPASQPIGPRVMGTLTYAF